MPVEPYEEYKLLVHDTALLSERRHETGTLYLTANSILLGATAILIQQSGLKDYLALALAIVVAGAGLSLSQLGSNLSTLSSRGQGAISDVRRD